ncbi:ATP cone domain-containing protein, partial [Flavihumibacter sediminis]|nr:ATP cone domain-containing protein [Flavihumibacter sediminis]
MRDNNRNINVTKASGIRVPFNKNKLKQSLLRSGASSQQAEDIANEIVNRLVDNISTKEIYRKAFRLLKDRSRPMAARYKLKRALMELGPSGFPFEQFVAELLTYKGYKTEVGVTI